MSSPFPLSSADLADAALQEDGQYSAALPMACSAPPPIMPALATTLTSERAAFIMKLANKWANGTVLHYYFFDDKARDFTNVEQQDRTWLPVSWVGDEAQRDVVRRAFKEWKSLGIGLEFVEVGQREEAEVRIGFMPGDGSWSYIGKDIVSRPYKDPSKRTMNLGWDLLDDYGYTTALHEIGHTLGLPHEHQSPFSGIVWDEPAVLRTFAAGPNFWKPDVIKRNILDKLSPEAVQGSIWDPDSIMHYEFGPGLIQQPPDYFRFGLKPPGKLSASDVAWVRHYYPPLSQAALPVLQPLASTPLNLANGDQADFSISPAETRDYSIATFGRSDSQLILFEERDGVPRFHAESDDSGQDTNARLTDLRLVRGRSYILRVRLKYRETGPPPAVMLW